MNTSAFATAIRIKLEKHQYKTYFFLFAFCLITTSVSLENIIGNLIAEKLEVERKRDFAKGMEASIQERWKLHMSQIRSYAYWTDVWDLIKKKKLDVAYLNFQLDPAIDKQFDFFAIYLKPEKEFILKWSDGSGEKLGPNKKIISHFFETWSEKEGHGNYILFFNKQYYLVSVTSLADDRGIPMIEGIMVFAYRLDNFIAFTSSLFPIQIEILEGDDLPLNIYNAISLEKYILPSSKKVSLLYNPNTLRITVVRPFIIGILVIFSVINLCLFAWILYRIKEQDL